jgi:hypothetical protein
MAGIVAVVDMAIIARTSVIPRTCSYEQTAVEPIRAIVAIRRTVVGLIVIVAIRAPGCYSNTDRHLGG